MGLIDRIKAWNKGRRERALMRALKADFSKTDVLRLRKKYWDLDIPFARIYVRLPVEFPESYLVEDFLDRARHFIQYDMELVMENRFTKPVRHKARTIEPGFFEAQFLIADWDDLVNAGWIVDAVRAKAAHPNIDEVDFNRGFEPLAMA